MNIKLFIGGILILLTITLVYGEKDFAFLENKGQWSSKILFKAKIANGYITFLNDQILYQLLEGSPSPSHHHSYGKHPQPIDTNGLKGHVIAVKFINPDHLVPNGNGEKGFKTHFFNGKRGNQNDVKSFSEIKYTEIWNGIDFSFAEKNELPKYEYHVRSGADVTKIKLRYDGAEAVYVHEGKLVIKTSMGEIIEQKPYAFQDFKEGRREVECRYHLEGKVLSFEFPKGYDHQVDLVIDPALIFSTYSGSHADNWGNTATYDKYGNMYSGGIVFGVDSLPITPGPFASYTNASVDVLILKYDPKGTNLLYALYLGGSQSEFPRSMIVNSKDELIILGTTDSPDFPITSGALDPTYAGGDSVFTFYNFAGTPLDFPVRDFYPWFTLAMTTLLGPDMFLSKISFNGDALLASTFIGGSGSDGYLISKGPLTKNYGDQLRGEVIVDEADNIYFASNTYSNDIPNINGFDNSANGLSDGLIGKVSSDLTSVYWMSYLGGFGDDIAFGIKVDSLGNSYVTGGTNSSDIFSPATGINPTLQGDVDGYIAKIDPSGQILLASTYLGTPKYDQSYFLDLDTEQNVYVLGQTDGNYPMDTSVYHVPNGGQFIHALSNNLDTTIFSTVFGSGSGKPDISLTAFLVNYCSKIYISGWGGNINERIEYDFFGFNYVTGYVGGSTTNLPLSPDAYQTATDGSNFYFLVLSKKAKSMEYATFFGGNGEYGDHVDGGTSRFDKNGYIYQSVCAGCGGNSSFPTSPNAWSRTNKSPNCNNAALKFDLSTLRAKFETYKSAWLDSGFNSGCAPLKVLFNNESIGGNYYEWIWGNGTDTTIVQRDSISHTFPLSGKIKVQLVAYDNSTCAQTDTASTIIQVGNIAALTPDTTICYGSGFFPILISKGDTNIHWTPNYSISDTTIGRPFIHPLVTTTYHVTVMDSLGCTSSDSAKVSIKGYLKANFQTFKTDTTFPGFHEGCVSLPVLFKDSSIVGNKFSWSLGNGQFVTTPGSFFLDTYTASGIYQARLIVTDTVCHLSDTLTKNILASMPTATFPSNFIMCALDSVLLKVQTATTNSVSWLPPLSLGKPFSVNTNFFDTLSHAYVITIKDTLSCTITDTLKITAKNTFPKANFQTYNPDSTSPGYNQGCVPLSILFKNESSGEDLSYWNFGNGQTSTSSLNKLLSTYSLRNIYTAKLLVTNTTCGLKDSLSKPITALQPTATFPPDLTNCNLDSITLTVNTSPFNTVSWLPPIDLGSPYAATTHYLGYTNQTYTILVKDVSNCTVSGTLNITAKNQVPVAKFNLYNLPDSTLSNGIACAPFNFFAKDNSQFSDQNIWNWQGGTRMNQKFVTASFSSEGVSSIRLIAINSFCNLRDTATTPVRISVPHVLFPSDSQVCIGTHVQLNVKSNSLKSIDWNPDININNNTISNPIVWANMSLRYEVTFLDTNGCTASDTVHVSNFPVEQPNLVKQIAFCKKQTATVSLDPGTFKTYRWNDNSTDQVLLVDTAGFYKVSLSDFNNCQYTDSATVVQICAPIVFVPSGFSPNGDGKNDQFEVFGTYVTTFTIDIFNRWGELIYHSDDFGFKWDGTYRSVDVPIGVYPYTIHYGGTTTEGVAVKESLKGNVTVIR